MKLRYEALLGTSIVWIVFLLTSVAMFYSFLTPMNFGVFITVNIAFYCILYALLHLLIIKRLERLDQKTTQTKFLQQDETEHNDEITSLTSQIDKLITTINNKNEKLTRRWQKQENAPVRFIENHNAPRKNSLTQLAHYDNLTSLPNHVFFNEMFNKTLNHASKQNQMCGILFIDIYHFKNVNDTEGYEAGNHVLKEITTRFTNVLRSSDILARLGGDEFIVLLNDIENSEFANEVAERLLETCSQPIIVNEHEYKLTASIGICIFPYDGTSLEYLQHNADIALSKAKKLGGGVYRCFAQEMSVETKKDMQLDFALRKAINNKEFVLYFQPILNLVTGDVSSVEALVRWDNPDAGLISPDTFLPYAEESGLILEIGEWALREACRINKLWQSQGYKPIIMSVNLSPVQFNNENTIKLVKNILDETELNPRYLQLEITETSVMKNAKSTIRILNEMKDLGVIVCLDDFGTGFSSISYFKDFPIDTLKIDKSFIKGIPVNQSDIAITNAIIALGHNLEMKIIAEGVESAEQLQYLIEHKCNLAQGYYFSRPLPEQKIVLHLDKQAAYQTEI